MGSEGLPPLKVGRDRDRLYGGQGSSFQTRSLILVLILLALILLGAGLVTLVLQLGRSIINAEEMILHLAEEMSVLKARVDSFPLTAFHAVSPDADPERPVFQALPPQPFHASPAEVAAVRACVAAQVKLFNERMGRGHGKVRPFSGADSASHPDFYRHLPAVSKSTLSASTQADPDPDTMTPVERGCAIFDIGMNKARKLTQIITAVQRAQGNYSIDTLECDFYAYEPVHARFVLAQARVREQFSERARRRIHLYNKAVGAQVGTMSVWANEGGGDTKAILTYGAGKGTANKSTVPVTSIDHEIESTAGGRRVALMKIDNEGQEAQALQGARASLESKLVDCLVWERHPHWRTTLRLPSFVHEINHVAAYGYRVYLQDKERVLRVDGAYWDHKLEPTKSKVDAIAVQANSALDAYIQTKLLPECRGLHSARPVSHLAPRQLVK